jgi:hypothetical protein
MLPIEPHAYPPICRDRTAIAALLTLGAASLLDVATSTSLSLTDRAPSLPVVMFRLADAYASPVALVTTLIAALFWLWRRPRLFKLGFDLTLLLAIIALLDNLVGLIVCLFDKSDDPGYLLLSACLVYLENIAAFAAFYWRFDHDFQRRIAGGEETHPGIVFPHNSMSFKTLHHWRPSIVDYLFLSFNTSSTFGPTLPIPLRGSIQMGMMLQVAIAMAVLVMLAARAIGLIT